MIVDSGKYYLYRHIRKDKEEPFYIGIGTKNKDDLQYYTYTRSTSTSNRNRIWHSITSKSGYNVEVLIESDDYEFVKQKEKEIIKLYGRLNIGTGSLCNLTDGGEGVAGHVISEETRTKLINSHKGKRLSPESQAKRVKTLKEKYAKNPPVCTEAQKEKLRAYQLGRKQSAETIEKRVSKIRGVKRPDMIERGRLQLSKKVVDTKTNTVYSSIKEAAGYVGIRYTTLRAMLKGQNPNKTSLTYYNLL